MTAVYRSLGEIPAGFGPTRRRHRKLRRRASRPPGNSPRGRGRSPHAGHALRRHHISSSSRTLLRPQQAPGLLTPMEDRIRTARGHRRWMQSSCCASTPHWHRLTGRQFVQQVLVGALGVRALHEGGNFRFGHKAECGIAELAAFGREFGFTVTIHAPFTCMAWKCRAPLFEKLLPAGDMKRCPLDAGPAVRNSRHSPPRSWRGHAPPRPYRQPRAIPRPAARLRHLRYSNHH